jgi:hypothetical protein
MTMVGKRNYRGEGTRNTYFVVPAALGRAVSLISDGERK